MTDNFTPLATATRPRIKVIFEFYALEPKLIRYRGVQVTDGGFRMEKRGEGAKKYKAFMWCGSVDGIFRHRSAVEHWYECYPVAIGAQVL